ncbi:hypothetical protein M404DRAFT_403553 [Pisolithus tinctorius Marx 270]|uniref:Uncharacterized protein n=1 Tax=Pisolithus tinctorius Marx 270 TaxID=870435 RepID=A0A0C3MZA7_PISTI|nr:hypothetical protein M404DRAFT_403553 [Pisolithus tinctorius Marx 270]
MALSRDVVSDYEVRQMETFTHGRNGTSFRSWEYYMPTLHSRFPCRYVFLSHTSYRPSPRRVQCGTTATPTLLESAYISHDVSTDATGGWANTLFHDALTRGR